MSDMVANAVKIRLGDVLCQDIDKTGPADGEVFTYVDISSIDRDSKKITDAKEVSAGDAPSRAKQRLQAGDVLVSMTRPNLNAIAMVPPRLDQAIGSTGFHVLRSQHINPHYIFNLVKTREFIDALCQCVQGALYPAVRPSDIESFEFLLPPESEQQRIVAKLDELFSELDKGVENLRTAQKQLKVYRQALLKQAFEGKLTADWRAQNPDKLESAEALLVRIQKEREACYQQQLTEWREAQQIWEAAGKIGSKPAKPRVPKVQPLLTTEELMELPGLPEGWAWGRLGFMTCGVEYGTAAKSSETGKVAVLRMGNIQNSRFDWQDLVYTDDADEIAKYSLRHDDVLFNRTNSPELVGKAAIYKSEQPALFAGYLIRLNQIGSIAKAQFVNLFLASHVAKQHGSKVKTDGVNQSNINGEKLANYPFPYCHVSEQDAVVAVLEDKLSNLEKLESTITTSLQQAEALRQSILKKAFSGQLVPQHSDDEPASVLLERIRSERTAQQPARKRGRKVAKPA
ncbi:restriction endonuclease subunit S [Aeromonas veronii]|nr:restriction endonuclease subunit S [Aeromonas veronii]